MKLTTRIIVSIAITNFVIISIIFGVLAFRYNQQMESTLLENARLLYRTVITVRNWAADYGGVFVKKTDSVTINPFLAHPLLFTKNGDTLVLKNPALITRELSELSSRYLGKTLFHMTSDKYINPLNKPDDFEKKALAYINSHPDSSAKREFYTFTTKNGILYFRYFGPLYTQKSCLSCHADQGYHEGDLRGGISIHLPAQEYQINRQRNFVFIAVSSMFTILILSVVIFLGLKRTVVTPIQEYSEVARKIEKGEYDFPVYYHYHIQEIDQLGKSLDTMKTAIKEYTTQLEESRKVYLSLIQNSPEAIAIADITGMILQINEQFEQLFGIHPNQLTWKNFYDFIDIDRKKDLSQKEILGENKYHYEVEITLPGKESIPVEVFEIKNISIGPLQNVSFIYLRDLRLRKKLEQYSIQTEKMVVLGELAASIAHEIRNPLFALNNNLDYLKKIFSDTEEFSEIYPELKESIEKIHKIVSAILDYARPHPPEFRIVNLVEIIDNSLTLVKKKFERSDIHISKNIKCNSHFLRIHGDPHQLEQVFLNLFVNAYHSMEHPGNLIISIQCQNNQIEVKISDTGKGIPSSEISRIFDPFYTRFPGGTGLGLSIVNKILSQHDVPITVESQIGKGTTFTLLFKQYGENKNEI